jgi:hypothetical protein
MAYSPDPKAKGKNIASRDQTKHAKVNQRDAVHRSNVEYQKITYTAVGLIYARGHWQAD